ncbi:MAG: exodeoxyribonuclease VII large subunit [Acidobacteriota bacterium]
MSELGDELREILNEAFRGFWVRGEVHRPRASQRGHLYFELVEKGRGDRVVGKLDGVLWSTDHRRVRRQLAETGVDLVDGQEVRCFGQIDFYPPSGRLQLVVREVDPLFTLGNLERRRRETLVYLERSGLLTANAEVALDPVPLRIGLVTSAESAAYHDFLTGLAESGYGFHLLFVHAAVQGATAESEVVSGLRLLGSAQEPLDAIVLVRGGGSKTDLAAFDSRAVSEAIARCPRPVLCGLGHEIDHTLSDVVCHGSFKTPTKVAEHLVDRVGVAEGRLVDVQRGLATAADRCIARGERDLDRAGRLAQVARLRLDVGRRSISDVAGRLRILGARRLAEAGRDVEQSGRRLARGAGLAVGRQRPLPEALSSRIAAAASARLEKHRAVLDGAERICHELSPERVLERGFSITRDGGGGLVTRPDQVRSEDRLETRLAGGTLVSRVEEP